MKAIIIDDNASFVSKINDAFKNTIDNEIKLNFENCKSRNINLKVDSPRNIAQATFDTFQENLNVMECKDQEDKYYIFINIEGKFGESNHQDQRGVEILMWLRCKHKICNPIILYSFQSNHQLLKQKPEHLAINSEGCYYFQLPFDFSEIKKKINDKKLECLKDWIGLKNYLRPAINLDEFRHKEANWWGVKCLWDVHSLVREGAFVVDYPIKVERELQEIKNCIADFCYGLGNIRINEYIDTERQNILNQLTKITKLVEQVTDTEGIESDELKEVIENFNYEIGLFNFLGRETDQKIIIEIEPIEIVRKKLDTILKDIKNENIKGSIPSILSNLKILHIDDQASDGWSEIFNFMFFNEINTDKFRAINVKDKIKINSSIDDLVCLLHQEIILTINPKNEIDRFDPDIILLDLRLNPKWDDLQNRNLKNVTGYKLLQKIREEYPGTPVIMTTASNKIWSYEEMMKLGADAFWVKEGIDSNFTIEESIRNYLNILRLVSEITNSKNYKFIKSISNSIKILFNKKTFWWENKNWNFEYIYQESGKDYVIIPQYTTGNKNTIREILWNSVTLLRQYSQTTMLRIGYDTWAREEWYLSSEIIRNISFIIEVIHEFNEISKNVIRIRKASNTKELKYNNYDDGITLEGTKLNRLRRNDSKGKALYEKRNKASHYAKAKKLTANDYQEYFEKIIEYLENGPDEISELEKRYERALKIYDSNGKEINEKLKL